MPVMTLRLPADDHTTPGATLMTVQCCVCHKYRVKDAWKKNAKVESPLSHTYCPKCKEEALRTTLKRDKKPALAK